MYFKNKTLVRPLPYVQKTKKKRKEEKQAWGSWRVGNAWPSSYSPSWDVLLYPAPLRGTRGSLAEKEDECCPDFEENSWTKEPVTCLLKHNKEPG